MTSKQTDAIQSVVDALDELMHAFPDEPDMAIYTQDFLNNMQNALNLDGLPEPTD